MLSICVPTPAPTPVHAKTSARNPLWGDEEEEEEDAEADASDSDADISLGEGEGAGRAPQGRVLGPGSAPACQRSAPAMAKAVEKVGVMWWVCGPMCVCVSERDSLCV